MPIPPYDSLYLPILKLLGAKGQVSLQSAYEELSDEFKLTPEERSLKLPSGKQTVMRNRVGWSKTYLYKSALITQPSRGVMALTQRGKEVLAKKPEVIDNEFLKQFPEFLKFKERSPTQKVADAPQQSNALEQTPEETFESAYQELKDELVDQLLERISRGSPSFFERLVIDVLVGMGYGGTHAEAGKAIGKSGDEGIDGIINEDRLGLDVIYIQAKRWTGSVGRPEVQKFAGALLGKKARKGVFITTSLFTDEAKEFVKNLESKIVLVDGRQLAELMIEHEVGLTSAGTYKLQKLDLEYFSEDDGI